MADATEFVYVRLSGDSTSTPGRVSRTAFEDHWKAKGFVLVDDDEAAFANSPESPDPSPSTRKKA